MKILSKGISATFVATILTIAGTANAVECINEYDPKFEPPAPPNGTVRAGTYEETRMKFLARETNAGNFHHYRFRPYSAQGQALSFFQLGNSIGASNVGQLTWALGDIQTNGLQQFTFDLSAVESGICTYVTHWLYNVITGEVEQLEEFAIVK